MKINLLRTLLVIGTLFANTVSAQESSGDWTDLLPQVDPSKNAVAGTWQKTGNSLTTDAVRSARLSLPFQPKSEYDYRVQFTRTSGVHSVALMFVTAGGQATFEVDAWGQHLAGLQMINGQSMQNNATKVEGQILENGRRYTATVQVRKDRVRALLDDKLIADYKTDGAVLSVPEVWQMPDARSLGIGAYEAATTFHKVEVRQISGGAVLVASSSSTTASTPPQPRPPSTVRPAMRAEGTSGKRVLLVIANQDFFYREYHDPKQQLERAGITVDVAAGQKVTCRPHNDSGQQGSGDVMPDLTIADADVSRYDAIMFSGGWGSSMYQYAFRGSYSNRSYNGDQQTKAAVNKLLNEFIEQDKYVGALCHGVSVLAWARVGGKSILEGRRAVGSPRQSPSGIYNGQAGQPLSRWNAEVNGAKLTPARSIGNPRTSEDDVLVDGKIITGEDDNSALLFGATLARLLAEATN